MRKVKFININTNEIMKEIELKIIELSLYINSNTIKINNIWYKVIKYNISSKDNTYFIFLDDELREERLKYKYYKPFGNTGLR